MNQIPSMDEIVSARRRVVSSALVSSGRVLGGLSAVLCLFSLFGYALGIEGLYRPLNDGAATHPLTAVTIICLGISIAIRRTRTSWSFQLVFVLVATLLPSLKLLDAYTGQHVSVVVTPFESVVRSELAMGRSNEMGANTALMLLAISLSVLLLAMHNVVMSQLCSFAALAIPMVSIIGYAYGFQDFFGQMSLLTTIYGICLGVASMSLTSGFGALRAILSPYIGGRIARLQILIGTGIPILLGFLFVKTLLESSASSMFVVFVVTSCWFTLILVASSAVFQERVDKKRRRAEQALFYAATHDPLTDLSNRRKFMEVTEHEILRARRTAAPLWLFTIDVDHFKRINDTAGHAMGDTVLVRIALILAKSVRATDYVARLGGEEFAILLTEANEDGALRVADKICQQISQADVRGLPKEIGNITVSIGLACLKPDENLQSLLHRSDKAMYQAKDNGRNQVQVAG